MKLFLFFWFAIFFLFALPANSQEGWSFLNTRSIGASQFLQNRPQADGSNVTIIILDSGIDVASPGLQYLPDGKVKVIDVHDFSGEGDVYLDLAKKGIENEEKYLQTLDGLKLFGYDKLEQQAIDSLYYIGALDEYTFRNNDVNDINANGKVNDRFGVILFKNNQNNWVASVDLDGDGNLSDEKCVKDYAEDQTALSLRGFDKKYDYPPLNFALKIYPDQQKVNFHFDGSSHGTHVAGIAAGWRINGMESLNGIAPGAKIISLKIGNSRYSGASTTTGAMRDAFDYISYYAQSSKDALVINMSYGIGSEMEGEADIEYYINDILWENTNIVLCLSGGNKGPGLSTIGLPAAAANAITVGALNDAENARDIYGGNITTDKVYNFSSRGGEVAKPDIIAPGAASSTVPAFKLSENKRGTSMAAPQVAGAVALLFSAARVDFPNKKVDGFKVKKALLNSARLLEGYTHPDQGNGLINVGKAYAFLKEYLRDDEIVFGYDISTVNPFYESGYGSAIYWRYGNNFPTKKDKQTVFINALFQKGITASQKKSFYKAFSLSTTVDWLQTVQSNIYLKGTAPAEIDVYLDPDKLKNPGIYSGQIVAYAKTGLFSSSSNKDIEFRVWCTVVIPHQSSDFSDNVKKIKNVELAPGVIKREFLEISPVQSALAIRTRQNGSKYAHIRTYVHDPSGKVIPPTAILNTEKSDERTKNISKQLRPGTWEVVFYAPFTNPENSRFDYEFAVSELDVYPAVIRNFAVSGNGNPAASFSAVNNASKAATFTVGGSIMGVQRLHKITNAYSSYEHSFYVGDLYQAVKFEIELGNDIYNKLTDFTINIKNINGKILKTTALGYKTKEVSFVPPASGNYILELVPAFAMEEISWQGVVKESLLFFDQNHISRHNEVFYPFVEKKVSFSLTNPIHVAPEGYHVFGELWLDSTNQNFIRNIIPIEIITGLK